MAITLEKLKELMVAPHILLPRIAREKNTNEAVAMLVINWVLFSVAFSLLSGDYLLIPLILVSGIVGTIVFAFFFSLALTVLSGERDFTGVLIALTYPFFGVAVSSLLVFIFSLFSGFLATFLAFILFLLYFTVALTGMFRVIMYTHKLDAITVWIATSLLFMAAFVSAYLVAGMYAFKARSILYTLQLLM